MFPVWQTKKVMCKELEDRQDKSDCENIWPVFFSSSNSIRIEVWGFVKRKHEDWFDDNDAEIEKNLQEKRKSLLRLFRGNLSLDERRKVINEMKDTKNKSGG